MYLHPSVLAALLSISSVKKRSFAESLFRRGVGGGGGGGGGQHILRAVKGVLIIL